METTTNPVGDDPFAIQVGGSHYKQYPLEPAKFALVNGWDGAATHFLKYISRHRQKGGLEDVRKARHWVLLRYAENGPHLHARCFHTMNHFIDANGLEGTREAAILRAFDAWIQAQPSLFRDDGTRRAACAPFVDRIIALIDDLIANYEST